MATFYWHKAAPGLYYLWDRRPSERGKERVGKVIRRHTGGWLGAVTFDGMDFETVGRTNHNGMIGELETHISRRRPGSTFHRENF